MERPESEKLLSTRDRKVVIERGRAVGKPANVDETEWREGANGVGCERLVKSQVIRS
jgi:hypothetical protein